MTPIHVALGLDLSAGILMGCVMVAASFRLINGKETDRW